MSKWISVSESLPSEDMDCEVLYEDGSTGVGNYLGNDRVAPLDGWILDVSHEFPDPKDHGNIVKWRKLP